MAVPGLVVTKRLRLEGFIVMDFYDQRAEAEARLARWVEEGKIKAIVDVVDGLDMAPQALIGLFEGRDQGNGGARLATLVATLLRFARAPRSKTVVRCLQVLMWSP